MFPSFTRKHMSYVMIAIALLVIVLMLAGCGTLNPACGGARGC